MFEIIREHLDGIQIDYLIVDKPKTTPFFQDGKRFYSSMLGHLLQHAVASQPSAGAKCVTVITDTIPVRRQRGKVEQGINRAFRAQTPPGKKWQTHHHYSRSHCGLQVADYCCWAAYRKLLRNDAEPFSRIESTILSRLDIFRFLTTRYYQAIPLIEK